MFNLKKIVIFIYVNCYKYKVLKMKINIFYYVLYRKILLKKILLKECN